MTESNDYLKELKTALDDSSTKVRNLYTAFLAYLTYALIAVGGTTDMQLLKLDSKITLPLLQADIPIAGFYFTLPLLILAIYYDLILNFLVP